MVDSTGRRNGLGELLWWCHELKGLAWPPVRVSGHLETARTPGPTHSQQPGDVALDPLLDQPDPAGHAMFVLFLVMAVGVLRCWQRAAAASIA